MLLALATGERLPDVHPVAIRGDEPRIVPAAGGLGPAGVGALDVDAAQEPPVLDHGPEVVVPVVMDRHWNVLRTNTGANELFGAMLDLDTLAQPANVLELVFDPAALRPHILAWDVLAPALLARARREAVGGVLDGELHALVTRLETQVEQATDAPDTAVGRLIDVAFAIDGRERRFFSTVTTLGTPLDIALQEIRVDLFHPADDATRKQYAPFPR